MSLTLFRVNLLQDERTTKFCLEREGEREADGMTDRQTYRSVSSRLRQTLLREERGGLADSPEEAPAEQRASSRSENYCQLQTRRSRHGRRAEMKRLVSGYSSSVMN